MPRSNSWETYRRGAVILGPILGVCLLYGVRVYLRVHRAVHEHDRATEVARIRAAAEEEVQKSLELAQLEANARARAAQQPKPASSSPASTVATGQHWPEAIAVDAKHAYWLNVASGEVLKAPKDGGPPVVLASKQVLDTPRHAQTLAIDNDAVYWVTSGTREAHRSDAAVMRVAKTGGEPTVLASGQTRPNAIAVRGGAVYWITGSGEAQPGFEAPPGSVMRVKATGGKPENLSTATAPCGLAVDDTHVYWAETEPRTLTINKTPKGGGDTVALVRSTGRLGCSLGVDATHVYWINKSNDAVMRARKSGEDVMEVAVVKQRLSVIALDKSALYALTAAVPDSLDGSGGVWQLSKDHSGKPLPLVLDQPGINDLAFDGSELFWTRWSEADGDGSVLRLPKSKDKSH